MKNTSSTLFLDKEWVVPFQQHPTGAQVVLGLKALMTWGTYLSIKKIKRYLDSLNIYSLNHKSIAQRMKTVQEDCLKVCKTYCDKRRKTQCKDQTFNINMEKKLNVWKHDISRIKKLKTKYDMKVNDDEKNLHQDNCYGRYMVKYFDVLDPAWANYFWEKKDL